MPVDAVTVRAWRPAVPGVREALEARFAEHAYPTHSHDAWTVFLVDDGAVRYDLDGRGRIAEPARLSLLPPWLAHDGQPATSAGYRMRVAYLDPDLIGRDLVGAAVDRPQIADPALAAHFGSFFDALGCPSDALEAESRMAYLVDALRTWFGAPDRPTADWPTERTTAATAAAGRDRSAAGRRTDLAEQVRAWLDGHLAEPVTVAGAAAHVAASPTQVVRAFRQSFGIAPHTYVVGRRLESARRRILDGEPLAEVAADVGFCDQAHLTRRFKRFLGVTPGRYAGGRAR